MRQIGFHEFKAFIIRRGTSGKEVQDIVSAIGNYGSARPLASTKSIKAESNIALSFYNDMKCK